MCAPCRRRLTISARRCSVVPTCSSRRFWTGSALLGALVWFAPALSAQETSPSNGVISSFEKSEKLEDVRRQAREAEQRGEWLKACWRYDELLRRDRTNKEAREAYHRCLRRHQITV